jgi:hypothetical protein
MTWEQVAPQSSLERGWMQAVAVGGPGLVAVGSTEELEAAVWVSTDARDWERVGADSFRSSGDGEAFMFDVTSGPSGLVAVGGADGLPALWTSPDGSTWSRVHPDSGGMPGAIGVVAPTADGFVALGETYSEAGRQFVVWLSGDGSMWEPITEPGFDEGLGGKPFSVTDVAAGRDGLVAVGSIQDLTDDGEWIEMRAIAWTSADGRSWSLLPADAVEGPEDYQFGSGNPYVPGVWFVGDGYVAAGEGFAGGAAWTSPDGTVWRSSALITQDAHLRPCLRAVAASADGRLIGVGGTAFPDYGTPMWSVFWASDDGGTTWYQVSRAEVAYRFGMIDSAAQPWRTEVVLMGSQFVAVGHTGVYLDETVEELGDNYCGDTAIGSCRTDAAVWIGTWER